MFVYDRSLKLKTKNKKLDPRSEFHPHNNSTKTILDYLNEDCWREVLDYVPVKDVILSERVSRHWQRVVLVYLQNIRIGIYEPVPYYAVPHQDVCCLPLRETDWSSFNSWIKKPGPMVVKAYCSSEESFKIIGENCPYLEAVTINNQLPEKCMQYNEYEQFKKLRDVRFHCRGIPFPEHCFGQFIASNLYLEHLEIIFDPRYGTQGVWSGQFLTNINSTNLKSFVLKYSPGYGGEKPNFGLFLLSADRFSELTKFVLETDDEEFLENLHLLLEKMLKLEYLEVSSDTQECENFYKSVCKLKHLKYLNTDCMVVADGLELLARCPELRVLKLGFCPHITGVDLQALSARLPLVEFVLYGVRYENEISDDDVVDFVRACPSLKTLRIRHAYFLTDAVVACAAAARRATGARGPLRLDLGNTSVEEHRDRLGEHEELILEFSEFPED